LRTADIWSEGTTKVGTIEMGDAVVAALASSSSANATKTTITKS
jgi:3-isopropylmalate dehydrogenase